MKVKFSTRVCSFLLAVFIALGSVPVYSETDTPYYGQEPDGGDGSEGAEQTGSGEQSGEPEDEDGGEQSPGGDESGGSGGGGELVPGEGGEDQTTPREPGGNGDDTLPENREDEDPDENQDPDETQQPGEGGGSGTQSGRRMVVDFPGWEPLRLQVPLNTGEDALDLPQTLAVEYREYIDVDDEDEDGEEQTGSETLAVSWRCASYDARQAGSYRFVLVLPEGYRLDSGLSAPTVEVEVGGQGQGALPDEEALRVITAFPEYEGATPALNALQGTALEELPLPTTAEVRYYTEGEDLPADEQGGEEREEQEEEPWDDGLPEEEQEEDQERDAGEDDVPEQDPGEEGAQDQDEKTQAGVTTGRVGVRWTLLEEEYDPEALGTYHFQAELDEDGWTLAQDVELPVLAVSLRVGVAMARAGQGPVTVVSNGVPVVDYNNLVDAIDYVNTNKLTLVKPEIWLDPNYSYTVGSGSTYEAPEVDELVIKGNGGQAEILIDVNVSGGLYGYYWLGANNKINLTLQDVLINYGTQTGTTLGNAHITLKGDVGFYNASNEARIIFYQLTLDDVNYTMGGWTQVSSGAALKNDVQISYEGPLALTEIEEGWTRDPFVDIYGSVTWGGLNSLEFQIDSTHIDHNDRDTWVINEDIVLMQMNFSGSFGSLASTSSLGKYFQDYLKPELFQVGSNYQIRPVGYAVTVVHKGSNGQVLSEEDYFYYDDALRPSGNTEALALDAINALSPAPGDTVEVHIRKDIPETEGNFPEIPTIFMSLPNTGGIRTPMVFGYDELDASQAFQLHADLEVRDLTLLNTLQLSKGGTGYELTMGQDATLEFGAAISTADADSGSRLVVNNSGTSLAAQSVTVGELALSGGAYLGTNGDVEVEEGITIAAGATLDSGGKLTVDDGDITHNGTLLNAGGLVDADKITLGSGAKLTATGHVTADSGLTLATGANLSGNNVTVTNGDIAHDGALLAAAGLVSAEKIALGSGAQLTANGHVTARSGLTLATGASLSGNNVTVTNGDITHNGTLLAAAGLVGAGEITLGGGAQLTAGGNVTAQSLLSLGSGAKLSGGDVTVANGDIVHNGTEITATGDVKAADIGLGNEARLTAGNDVAATKDITLGDEAELTATAGNVGAVHIKLGSEAKLEATAGIVTATGDVTLADRAALTASSVSAGSGTLTLGDASTVTAYPVVVGSLASSGGILAYPASTSAITNAILTINNSAVDTVIGSKLTIQASAAIAGGLSFADGDKIITLANAAHTIKDLQDHVDLRPYETFTKFLLDKQGTDYRLADVVVSLRYDDASLPFYRFKTYSEALAEALKHPNDKGTINLWQDVMVPSATDMPATTAIIQGMELKWVGPDVGGGFELETNTPHELRSTAGLVLQADTEFSQVYLNLTGKSIEAGSHTLTFSEGTAFGTAGTPENDYTLTAGGGALVVDLNNSGSAVNVKGINGFVPITLKGSDLTVSDDIAITGLADLDDSALDVGGSFAYGSMKLVGSQATVDEDLTGTGAVTLEDSTLDVGGTFSFGSMEQDNSNVTVDEDATGTGAVTLKNGSTLDVAESLSFGSMEQDNSDVTVGEDATGTGTVTLDDGSTLDVGGSLSFGSMTLEDSDVTVGEDATATGAVTLGGGSTLDVGETLTVPGMLTLTQTSPVTAKNLVSASFVTVTDSTLDVTQDFTGFQSLTLADAGAVTVGGKFEGDTAGGSLTLRDASEITASRIDNLDGISTQGAGNTLNFTVTGANHYNLGFVNDPDGGFSVTVNYRQTASEEPEPGHRFVKYEPETGKQNGISNNCFDFQDHYPTGTILRKQTGSDGNSYLVLSLGVVAMDIELTDASDTSLWDGVLNTNTIEYGEDFKAVVTLLDAVGGDPVKGLGGSQVEIVLSGSFGSTTVTALADNDGQAVYTFPWYSQSRNPVRINAGSYTVDASYQDDLGASLTATPVDLQVGKRALTASLNQTYLQQAYPASGGYTKTYDGTNALPWESELRADSGLFTLDRVMAQDGAIAVTATGFAFTNPYVEGGAGKEIEATGPALVSGQFTDNYQLLATTPTGTSAMEVTPRELKATPVGTITKAYDGTTAAPVGDYKPYATFNPANPTQWSLQADCIDRPAGRPAAQDDDIELITLEVVSAAYAQSDAATSDIAVNIVWSISGYAAGGITGYSTVQAYFDDNYQVVAQAAGAGRITPKELALGAEVALQALPIKDYDGNAQVKLGAGESMADYLYVEASGAVSGQTLAFTPVAGETAYFVDSGSDASDANVDPSDSLLTGYGYYGARTTLELTAGPGVLLSNYTTPYPNDRVSHSFGAATAQGAIRQIEAPVPSRVIIPIKDTDTTVDMVLQVSYTDPEAGMNPGVVSFDPIATFTDSFFSSFSMDAAGLATFAVDGGVVADDVSPWYPLTIHSTNYTSKNLEICFVISDLLPVPWFELDPVSAVYGDDLTMVLHKRYAYNNGSQTLQLQLVPTFLQNGTTPVAAPQDAGSYLVRVSIDDPAYIGYGQYWLTITQRKVYLSTNPDIKLEMTVGEDITTAQWGGYNLWTHESHYTFWTSDQPGAGRIAHSAAIVGKYGDTFVSAIDDPSLWSILNQDNLPYHTDNQGFQVMHIAAASAVSSNYELVLVWDTNTNEGSAKQNSTLKVTALNIKPGEYEDWLEFVPDEPNQAGWFSAPVTVQLKNTRPVSYYTHVGYSTDGSIPTTYYQVDDPNIHTLALPDGKYENLNFYIASNAGGANRSNAIPFFAVRDWQAKGNYWLDTNPPSIDAMNFVQDQEDSGVIRVTVSDATSGFVESSLVLDITGPVSIPNLPMQRVGDGIYEARISLAQLGIAYEVDFFFTVTASDLAGHTVVDNTGTGTFYDPDKYIESMTLYLIDGVNADANRALGASDMVLLQQSGTATLMVKVTVRPGETLPAGANFYWYPQSGREDTMSLSWNEAQKTNLGGNQVGNECDVTANAPALPELIDQAGISVSLMGRTASTRMGFFTVVVPTTDPQNPQSAPAAQYPDNGYLLLVMPLLEGEKARLESSMQGLEILNSYNWQADSRWMDIRLVKRYEFEQFNEITPQTLTGELQVQLTLPGGITFSKHNMMLFHLRSNSFVRYALQSVENGTAYQFSTTELSPFSLVWQDKADAPGSGGSSGGRGGGGRGSWGGGGLLNQGSTLYNDFWNQVIRAVKSAEPGGSVRADAPAYIRTMPATVLEALMGLDVTLHITWAGDPICIYGGNIMSVPPDILFFNLEDVIGMYGCERFTPPPAENQSLDNPNMGGDDIDIFNAYGERTASLSAISPEVAMLQTVEVVLTQAGIPRPEGPDVLAIQGQEFQMSGAQTQPVSRGRWRTPSVLLLAALFAAVVWMRYGRPEEASVAASLTGTSTEQLPAEPPLPMTSDDASRQVPKTPPAFMEAEPVQAAAGAPVSPRVSKVLASGDTPKRSREDVSFYNIIQGHKLLDRQLQDGIISEEECRMLKRRLTIHS